jgi:hypothetical protein
MIPIRRRKPLFVLLLLVVLLAMPFAAQAKLMFCRSDPVVILSNGTILDLSADVSTLLINVREVHYVLHVPVGVYPIVTIHTPAWLTSQETFTVISDQQPDTYAATATVRTRTGTATVRTNLLVLTTSKLKLGYDSNTGAEGEAVPAEINH